MHARGYRFRYTAKDLPGKPDLVLPKYRLAFSCARLLLAPAPGCVYASTPKSHVEFWQEKFARNVERDKRQQAELIEKGGVC
nr:very short patch repair endonuclease [Salinicola tamaricis]